MLGHQLVSFATVIALWTLVTFLMKLIPILLKWKFIQDQIYAILVAMLRKRSNFCRRNIVPVTGLERSYGKIYISFTEISVAKTEISIGYWASPAFHVNKSKFLQLKKKYRGEISEPEPARFTQLLWGGPNSMSMRKPIKTIVVKSPILLNLGINSYLGKWIIVAKKYVKMFHSSQVRATPCRSRNLTLIYAHLTIQLCFSISTTRKALWNRYPLDHIVKLSV